MTQSQLKEVIRHIVRETLNELMDSSSLLQQQAQQIDQTSADPNQPHIDDMSALEKGRYLRDLEKQRREKIKHTDMDLKITKKQSDYFDQQLDKNRMDVIAKEKELQQLKSTTSAI